MAKQRTFTMEAPCGCHKTPADPNDSAVTCYDCVYAVWDRNQWLRSVGLSWAICPTCANHPDSLGTMREIPRDGPCRNFRWKREPKARVTPPTPSSPDVAYISLSRHKSAIVDKGDFERLNKYKWFLMDEGRGKRYAGRWENGRLVLMHREIMQPPPGMVVHHINHNGLDNRRCNLQICTVPENQRYRRRGVNASGFMGVYARGKKWRAVLRHKGKVVYQRTFADKIEAAKARDDIAAALFGDAARANFPRPIPSSQPPTPPPDQPQPSLAPAHQPNSAKEGT